MKHTPGPWEVHKNGGMHGTLTFVIDTKYGDVLATLEPQLSSILLEGGNARLIASAPDLVESIRNILNGLYALRDHARDENGPEAGVVEQRLIDLGIEALKKAGV